MMHFPPVSDFPPISEKIFDFLRNFYDLTFSREISDDLFLASTTNIEFPPYFRCFSTFPPCFAKIILSPYIHKFYPPVLRKFTCFLHTLHVFSPTTLTTMHLCITQCTYWTPLPMS